MNRIRVGNIACIATLFCLATALAAHAQTLTNLYNFHGSDGERPQSQLIQGSDGNFYGPAYYGGLKLKNGGAGTLFRISPSGQFTLLYQFCSAANCNDGAGPSQLVQAPNGYFYGTTYLGGTGLTNECEAYPGCGTLFQISPDGSLSTLHNFCSQSNCTDGALPDGALVLGVNGELYGTTAQGGAIANFNCQYNAVGCGTIFDTTLAGTLTTVFTLCPNGGCTFGQFDGLMLATNGNFYGGQLNYGQGTPPPGLIYQFTPNGNFTAVYNAATLTIPPVEGNDGNLYGLAMGGTRTGGIFYRLDSKGHFTTLYNFCWPTVCGGDADPTSVVLASDGNFYGTAYSGGAHGNKLCNPDGHCGTIFKITPTGQFTTLYNFCSQANCADGAHPTSIMQATDGTFYGTTNVAGTLQGPCAPDGCGTIFHFSAGLPAFVETNPGFAGVGQEIGILGNNLTGATSVTFNGIAATFTVESDSSIMATVPNGATTGKIEVTTSSGTIASNVPFYVLP